jgi:hypothetical protein
MAEDFNIQIGLELTPASLRAVQTDINNAIRQINPVLNVNTDSLQKFVKDGLDIVANISQIKGDAAGLRQLKKTIEDALDIKINRIQPSARAKQALQKEIQSAFDELKIAQSNFESINKAKSTGPGVAEGKAQAQENLDIAKDRLAKAIIGIADISEAEQKIQASRAKADQDARDKIIQQRLAEAQSIENENKIRANLLAKFAQQDAEIAQRVFNALQDRETAIKVANDEIVKNSRASSAGKIAEIDAELEANAQKRLGLAQAILGFDEQDAIIRRRVVAELERRAEAEKKIADKTEELLQVGGFRKANATSGPTAAGQADEEKLQSGARAQFAQRIETLRRINEFEKDDQATMVRVLNELNKREAAEKAAAENASAENAASVRGKLEEITKQRVAAQQRLLDLDVRAANNARVAVENFDQKEVASFKNEVDARNKVTEQRLIEARLIQEEVIRETEKALSAQQKADDDLIRSIESEKEARQKQAAAIYNSIQNEARANQEANRLEEQLLRKRTSAQTSVLDSLDTQARIGNITNKAGNATNTLTLRSPNDIKNFANQLDSKSLEKFVEVLNGAGSAMGNVAGQQKLFSSRLAQGSNIIQRIENNLNSATKSAFDFGQQSTESAKRLLAWAGPATFIFSTVSALKDATRQLTAIDQSARRLTFFESAGKGFRTNTSTPGGGTGIDFNSFNKQIAEADTNTQFFINTAKKTGLALQDVVDATLTASRVGRDFSETIKQEDGSLSKLPSKFLETVLSLVRLEGGALKAEDAVNALNTIHIQFFDRLKEGINSVDLDAFNKTLEQGLAGAGALLAVVAADAAFSVNELADATSRVGAAFANISGTGLPQVITLIGKASSATGANVGRLATALRQLLTFSVQNADAIKKGFDIEVVNKSGGIKGFESILEILRKINELRGTEKGVELAKLIGDRRNVADIQSLAVAVGELEKTFGKLSSTEAEAKLVQFAVQKEAEADIVAFDSITAATNNLNTAFVELAHNANLGSLFKEITKDFTSIVSLANDFVNAISQLKPLIAGIVGFGIAKIAPQITAGIAGTIKGLVVGGAKDEIASAIQTEANVIKALNAAKTESLLTDAQHASLIGKAVELIAEEKVLQDQIIKKQDEYAVLVARGNLRLQDRVELQAEIDALLLKEQNLQRKQKLQRTNAQEEVLNTTGFKQFLNGGKLAIIGTAATVAASLFADDFAKVLSKSPAIIGGISAAVGAGLFGALGSKIGSRFGGSRIGGGIGATVGLAIGLAASTKASEVFGPRFAKGIASDTQVQKGISDALTSAVSGAEIGAIIGSTIAPGLGTVLGGVIGFVAGGILSAYKTVSGELQGELDQQAQELEARRKGLLAGIAEKAIAERRKQLENKSTDRQALIQQRINDLQSEQADIQRQLASGQLDTLKVGELTIRGKEVEEELDKERLNKQELEIYQESKLLSIQEQINQGHRQEEKLLKKIEVLEASIGDFTSERSRIGIQLDFDETKSRAAVQRLLDEKKVLEDKLKLSIEFGESFSNQSAISQQIADIISKVEQESIDSVVRKEKAARETLRIADDKVSQRIGDWEEAAKNVVSSFEKISSIQGSIADKFYDRGKAVADILGETLASTSRLLEVAGATTEQRLTRAADIQNRRLRALEQSAGSSLSALRSNVTKPFGSTAELRNITEGLVSLIGDAGVRGAQKVFDEDSKTFDIRLAQLRNEADNQRQVFELRINQTRQEIDIRKKLASDEIAILKERQEIERRLNEERITQQKEFGRLLIEGPEQFLSVVNDIKAARQFFRGIQNIDVSGLRALSQRSTANRNAGNFEGLQSVLRGLEDLVKFGGSNLVGGVSNSQLQNIFERIQVVLPEDLAADLRRQEQELTGQTSIQQQIEQRQKQQAALLEAEAALSDAQLKVETAAQNAAIKQRDIMINLLNEAVTTQHHDLASLIAITLANREKFGNGVGGNIDVSNSIQQAIDDLDQAEKDSLAKIQGQTSSALTPSTTQLTSSFAQASDAVNNFNTTINRIAGLEQQFSNTISPNSSNTQTVPPQNNQSSIRTLAEEAVNRIGELVSVSTTTGRVQLNQSREVQQLREAVEANGGSAAQRARLLDLTRTEPRPQSFRPDDTNNLSRNLLQDQSIRQGLEQGFRSLFQGGDLVRQLQEARGTGDRGARAIDPERIREILGQAGLSGLGREVNSQGQATELVDKLLRFSEELNRTPDRLSERATGIIRQILSTELREGFQNISEILTARTNPQNRDQAQAANNANTNVSIFNQNDLQSFGDKFSTAIEEGSRNAATYIISGVSEALVQGITQAISSASIKLDLPNLEVELNGNIKTTLESEEFLTRLTSLLQTQGVSADEARQIRDRLKDLVTVMVNNGQLQPAPGD